MTREAAFTILLMPNGKYRLRHDKMEFVFETLADAEAGMVRIIAPEIRHYDAAGKLLVIHV